MDPAAAKFKIGALLDGAMRGRTMYVVPYIMGPVNSPISKAGVEITDSPYVVANMRIMARMGKVATDRIGNTRDFVPGLHSLGDLDPTRRYIAHFTEEKLIWSVGSGYGGNALLGKKCFALRIASVMAREQGWMAEHMLILGLESPGRKSDVHGRGVSERVRENEFGDDGIALESQGYRVWTVGDDIAWMKIGDDGYLHAINPEAGFFGVAPGTGMKTNRNVMGALRQNTIFTNVAITPDREPWWEGIGGPPPSGIDQLEERGFGTRPRDRRRIRTRATRCRRISRRAFRRSGKRRKACRFRRLFLADGGRELRRWCMSRSTGSTACLSARRWRARRRRRRPGTSALCDAIRWRCCRSADTTWRIISGIGWRWGRSIPKPPKIFHVNWFRKGADGKFLWPGFGENVRVLKWILERVEGRRWGGRDADRVCAVARSADAGWVEFVERDGG